MDWIIGLDLMNFKADTVAILLHRILHVEDAKTSSHYLYKYTEDRVSILGR